MDKTAQKRRGKIDALKEKYLHPGGSLMEGFSPEFQELMDVLRDTDDKARDIAAGDEGERLKDLLKVAKTNFNRREYMTAISFLGRFHDRLEEMVNEFVKLQNTVNMKHNEFLFGDVDKEHLEYLKNKLGPKFEKAKTKPKEADLTRTSLEKEAGLADWWHNLRSDRGRALSAWEKRFPKYAKELKSQTNMMLNRSETLLNLVLSSLKTMSGLRNARKLEEYIKVASKIQEKFKTYNMAFLQFYNSQVKPFMAFQEAIGGEDGADTIPEQMVEMPLGEQAGVLLKPIFDANKDKAPEEAAKPANPNWKPMPIQRSFHPALKALLQQCNKEQRIPTKAEVDAVGTLINPQPKAKEANSLAEWLTDEPSTSHFPAVLKNPAGLEDTMLSPGQKKPNSLGNMLPTPRNQDTVVERLEEIEPESLGEHLPSAKAPATKANPESLGNQLPDTLPTPPTLKSLGPHKKSVDHSSFLTSLAVLEDQHPMTLAKEILGYAESIEATDAEMSQRLLSIASNILKA